MSNLYSVVVTDKIARRFEVEARSGQEAAMKVGAALAAGGSPVEEVVVDRRIAQPEKIDPTLDLTTDETPTPLDTGI